MQYAKSARQCLKQEQHTGKRTRLVVFAEDNFEDKKNKMKFGFNGLPRPHSEDRMAHGWHSWQTFESRPGVDVDTSAFCLMLYMARGSVWA